MKINSKPLSAWSWQDIISLYKVYGGMMKEMVRIRDSFEVVAPRIDFEDQMNIFFMRFWSDVFKINRNIEALDREIARRNKLIGVI